MWILESTFDDEEVPFRKFLKPGGEYHFGRKAPADLVLADKTVSKESATINVGRYEPGEEHNPPKLTIHALKRSIRIIDEANQEEWERNREGFIGEMISPDSRRVLRPGDVVVLTKSAPGVKVLWSPVVFSVSSKLTKEAIEQQKQDCHLLGIGMERSKQYLPHATHFVLPTSAALTAPLMQAIMAAAHLVTMEYVDELLKRAKLERDDGDSLEKRFRLPKAEAYFPEDVEIEGMSRPQATKALAANERRKTMFVGTTFLFVHGDGGLSKSLETSTALCKAGRGRVVVENVAKLRDDDMILRLLRRNLSEAQTLLAECGEAASEAPDEGLVVICSNEDTDADWHSKLVRLTRQMKIAMPSQYQVAISHAILHADARRYLNEVAGVLMDEQMLQSTNCETLPPTAPPQHKMAHLPPATPAMDLDEDDQHRSSTVHREASPTVTTTTALSTSATASETQRSPRKPRRRADMARRDPFDDIFGSSVASSVTATETSRLPATGEGVLPTPTPRHTAKPRRYDGTDNKRPRVSETWRSIFDTDTDGTQGMDHDGAPNTYTQDSQSKTRRYRQELDEADRLATQGVTASAAGSSQAASQVNETTRKRRAQSPVVEDSQPARQRQRQSEEMEQDNDGFELEEPSSTMPAPTASLANTVIHADKKGTLTDKTGNSDTDTKFLQAMATSKRSKKGLDQFDKEFNLLRLAKPAHATGHHGKIIADADDPEYRAWEQMGASDFDINAAGNFVQVDFVPLIYHRSEEEEQERARRQIEMQEKWNGKPNFKKFRTKERKQRKPMMLDVDEGLDYGLGDGYARIPTASARPDRREMVSFSDEDNDDVREVELMGPPPKPGPSRKKNSYQHDPFSDDDDDVMPSTVPSSRSTQSTTATQQKQRKKTTSPEEERRDLSQRKRAVDVRLDVDADLDDSIYRNRPRAPTSTSSSTTIASAKRDAIQLSSDEDDDDGGFSGFRKKRKG